MLGAKKKYKAGKGIGNVRVLKTLNRASWETEKVILSQE